MFPSKDTRCVDVSRHETHYLLPEALPTDNNRKAGRYYTGYITMQTGLGQFALKKFAKNN